ncbi:MAG: hypothetical protein N3D12_05495 [Candidatus Methanomethyliaceae archaeon]|nr:hypothetical protein [Candidatus Methanomethyliaceae archaeon]
MIISVDAKMPQPRINDDYPHSPSQSPDWRESYYFNFVDAKNGISSFSTIGLLPNLGRREFVFAIFCGGSRKIYYNEISGQFDCELASLSDGQLSYELVEPLGLWRISFSDRDVGAEILWKARFSAYSFGRGSGTSWAEHFEQSGSVSGVVRLPDGKKIIVNGLGQRDKSWGSRSWHIDSWFALHAQFDHMSIGLRKDVVGGKNYVSGAVMSEGPPDPLSGVEVQIEQVDAQGAPMSAKIAITTVEGNSYTLSSSLISPNSYARFSRNFPGGVTELFEGMAFHHCEELGLMGTGLLEWLFTKLQPNYKS